MAGQNKPTVRSLQTALFATVNLKDKLEVAQKITGKFEKIFDGDPILVPLPADAPAEIPRVVLRGKDDIFKCNVSVSRVDFFYSVKEKPVLAFEKSGKEIFPIAQRLGEVVIDEEIVSGVSRLGLVIDLFVKLDQSANKFLREKLLKKIPTGSPYESRLHFLYHDKIDGYEINRWIRLNPLRRTKDSEDDKALSFIVDINTLSEKADKYKFDKKSIKLFYKESFRIIRDDFRKYFGRKER